MLETSTNTAGEQAAPITLIGQVKRFDVIKMLERASTRLFHREERIHAAELAQAVLFLRQEPEALIGQGEVSRIQSDAQASFAKQLKQRMNGFDFERDDAPIQPSELEFIARRVRERIVNINQQLWDTQQRLKRAQNRLAKAKPAKKRSRQ